MARIMIVDDDMLVRWAISNGLKRDAHDVFCAQDGEEAVEKAQEITFDLVITDFEMPGMSGIEVLDRLHQLTPETKVMVLSACAGLNRRTLMEHGAHEYIGKPFMVDEIRDRVRMMIDK